MERFIRKLFGLTFSALLAVVMLFSSVTVFAEEYDSKYPSENVNIAKTRAEMFLNSVGKPALLEEGILLKNLNGEYEAVSFSMPENGYIIVNIKDLTIPELSFENSNPYDNVKNPIYNGVLSYYSKVGEEFVSLKDNSSVRIEQFENVYSKEEIADKEESIRTLENTLKNQLRHVNIERYINGSLKTWYISGGHCGSIASAICMRYYYDYVSTNYVSSGSIGQNALIALMQQYVGSGGTTYSNLDNGLDNYFNARNVNNSANAITSFSFSRVKTQINRSRPIIIGTTNHPTFGDHWIIGHGYFTSPVDGNYVIVNNGWGNNNVWIEPSTTYLDGTIHFTN